MNEDLREEEMEREQSRRERGGEGELREKDEGNEERTEGRGKKGEGKERKIEKR